MEQMSLSNCNLSQILPAYLQIPLQHRKHAFDILIILTLHSMLLSSCYVSPER